MEGVKPIPDKLYFRIGDVAEIVGVKPYVLRYWESEFPMISPEKSSSNQRVYRRVDVETVILIKKLLYEERYSIEGARKRIRELKREGGLKSLRKAVSLDAVEPTPASEPVVPAQVIAEVEAMGERRSTGLSRVRILALELDLLGRRPVGDFFR